ncbi:MAG: SGNH/GDSL hydrolase family protein [Cyanobacteriota bacterium]|jgi:outer membrane lipase/esterase
MKFRHWFALGSLFAAALPLPASAALASLNQLFVFGDSLSDGGNGGLLTGGAFPPAPYVGGRASNGPVAVEYLWSSRNPGNPSGFLPSLTPSAPAEQATNYAVIGSTSGLESNMSVSGFPEPIPTAFNQKANKFQLDTYTARNPGFDPDTALFVVWLYPNDAYYWLNTAAPSGGGIPKAPGTYTGGAAAAATADQMISNAISNIVGSINQLADDGATNFLVPNSPDLGLTPQFAANPVLAATASQLSSQFNTALEAALGQLQRDRPGIHLTPFQTDDLFASIRSNPGAYGFTNVTDRCTVIEAGQPVVSGTCNPDTWLFWDANHPTTAAHRVFGQAFAAAVIPVPSPLPLAGGLVAFRWSRRLRRRISRPLP